MKTRCLAVVLLVTWFFSLEAMAARFNHIDGKNYYQVLGVERNADIKTIRKAWAALVATKHPDIGAESDEEATKKFNEAFDNLRKHHADYDRWLGIGSQSAAQNASPQSERRRTDQEIRAELTQVMAEDILNRLANRQVVSLYDLARMAQTVIIYHQRYMPNAQHKDHNLAEMFYDASNHLNEHPFHALVGLAGGVILYFREIAADTRSVKASESAEEYLWNFENTLDRELRFQPITPIQRKFYTELQKIIERSKPVAPSPPPPPPAPPPRPVNQCEAPFAQQYAYVTQNGVTYRVPIQITISVGPIRYNP